MNDTAVDRINKTLALTEEREGCTILLAVESGSRAWGFASQDSDYDVRFIYARPAWWYLSIAENRRDVIELPITGDLDINGWDIRKALQLFRKSNPALLEWLTSPTVYGERGDFAGKLRALVPEFYDRRASFYHYLSMARSNLREYLRGDIVWVKKYFYVLRPILACRWIENHSEPVPMEFEKLVAATCPDDGVLWHDIARLVQEKRAGTELGKGPRIPRISEFVDGEIARLEGVRPFAPAFNDHGRLDELFRETIRGIQPKEAT